MTNTKNHGGKREGAMRPPYKDRGRLKITIQIGIPENDVNDYGGQEILKADILKMVDERIRYIK